MSAPEETPDETPEEQARAFLETARAMTEEAVEAALEALPKTVRDAYWALRKAARFEPKNERPDSREECLSPSARYRLVTSAFSTGPVSWEYSQGVVYRLGDDGAIATVQRNYGAFPHLFIEGHPKGDFLVCGEDYQGQTVIELTTGRRRDVLSQGADDGVGFCWASYRYDGPTQILVVCGCIWACPYEYRFFDFCDPMSGWPEIELDHPVDADDRRAPELDPDGTLRCYETRQVDDAARGEPSAPPIVDVIRTYKRKGQKLARMEEWISDYEKDRRRAREERERRDQEWTANFKAADPLYLTYLELLKDPALSPDSYQTVGQTWDGWCSDWKGNERRWCRRIVTHTGRTGPTVDLEWAVETGPIKLVLYRDGKSDGERFFEHSVEGMKQAFATACEYAAEQQQTRA
jgi:hypothetical protein